MMNKKIYFNVEEMAQIYMVKPATIRMWAREDKIPGKKMGRRWLFEKPTFIRLKEEKNGESSKDNS